MRFEGGETKGDAKVYDQSITARRNEMSERLENESAAELEPMGRALAAMRSYQ